MTVIFIAKPSGFIEVGACTTSLTGYAFEVKAGRVVRDTQKQFTDPNHVTNYLDQFRSKV